MPKQSSLFIILQQFPLARASFSADLPSSFFSRCCHRCRRDGHPQAAQWGLPEQAPGFESARNKTSQPRRARLGKNARTCGKIPPSGCALDGAI